METFRSTYQGLTGLRFIAEALADSAFLTENEGKMLNAFCQEISRISMRLQGVEKNCEKIEKVLKK